MTTEIDYVVRTYITDKEDNLLEKLFPPCSENRMDHQKAICKRLSEILTFEPGLEILALKMLGVEEYKLNVPCSEITYKESVDGITNQLLLSKEDKQTLAIISYFWKGAKPHIYRDFISFAGSNIFPSLDENNKLQSLDIYCSKVLDHLIDDSQPQIIDDVQSVHVSKSKILVNGSFEIPLNIDTLPRIGGYYIDKRLAGFVVDKFIFYFPDIDLKFDEMLFIIGNGMPERMYRPGKMVMAGVKRIVRKPNHLSSHFPTNRAEKSIDETTWNSFCRDFPDKSFEHYRLLIKEMEEARKPFNETGMNDSAAELLAALSLLMKYSGKKTEVENEKNESVKNHV